MGTLRRFNRLYEDFGEAAAAPCDVIISMLFSVQSASQRMLTTRQPCQDMRYLTVIPRLSTRLGTFSSCTEVHELGGATRMSGSSMKAQVPEGGRAFTGTRT